MKEYLVKITSQAQTHLNQIIKYISYELHALDAAMNLLDSLENAISSLSHFPNRIPLTTESPWKEKNITYVKSNIISTCGIPSSRNSFEFT